MRTESLTNHSTPFPTGLFLDMPTKKVFVHPGDILKKPMTFSEFGFSEREGGDVNTLKPLWPVATIVFFLFSGKMYRFSMHFFLSE